LNQNLLSLTKSQISDFTSGTVTSAGTAQQSGTATYATTSGTAVSISGSITKSQVSDFTSGTVTSAGFATTSGTAVYATTSGTSVSISGSITRSQVSDYATGTVANISGTVTQAQVSGLATTLTGYAALGSANTFTVGNQIVASQSDTVMPLVLRRASPTATASILEFQTSTGTAIASVSASGALLAPQATLTAVSTAVALTVNAQTSGTANTVEVYDNAGGRKVTVNQFGNITFAGALNASNAITSTYSALFTPTTSATVPVVVRGAASQSGDLQQWQSSGTAILANISSAGNIFGNSLRTNSSVMLIGTENSGAYAQFTKASSTLAVPGATGYAKMYFRDGTTGGTLKLVVRAGTAGAETTILDNIPQ
jgi:hypothetical protein